MKHISKMKSLTPVRKQIIQTQRYEIGLKQV